MINPNYKKGFLEHLNCKTYCRLGASNISGVGVFSIIKIPKAVNPFESFPIKEEFFLDVTEEELSSFQKEVQEYIKNFFAKDERGLYPVNATGLNELNKTHYVNHSDSPNLEVELEPINGLASQKFIPSNGSLNTFLTKREIMKGEELTCDYNSFFGVNNNKEQFDFLSKKNETSISVHEHERGKI